MATLFSKEPFAAAFGKKPLCIQETKWKGHEPEALYQSIPGVRIVHSPAIAFNGRACTGGVAILVPPGWSVIEEVELVKGRGVASLVQDRTCKFYVVAVYIHPDNRNGDTEALLRAWRFMGRFMDKKTDWRVISMAWTNISHSYGRSSCSSFSVVTFILSLRLIGALEVCLA